MIYLDMPTEKAVKMLRRRKALTHTKGDIHETDTTYLAAWRQTALEAAEVYGWCRVSCLNREGNVRRTSTKRYGGMCAHPGVGYLLSRCHVVVRPCAIACAKNYSEMKKGVYGVNVYVHSVSRRNH